MAITTLMNVSHATSPPTHVFNDWQVDGVLYDLKSFAPTHPGGELIAGAVIFSIPNQTRVFSRGVTGLVRILTNSMHSAKTQYSTQIVIVRYSLSILFQGAYDASALFHSMHPGPSLLTLPYCGTSLLRLPPLTPSFDHFRHETGIFRILSEISCRNP